MIATALALYILPVMAAIKIFSEQEHSFGIDAGDVIIAVLWPLICVAYLLGYEFEEGEDDV